MSALRLDYDNVIVGGGLAGLVAAMRLRGTTLLLSGGLGATAVSTGVFSSAGADEQAGAWLFDILRDTGCPYVRGKCITSSGYPREGLVQASTACDGASLPVALNEARAEWPTIEFMRGRSHQEIAKLLDVDDGACDELGSLLSGFKGESILLPPVLGITRAAEVRKKLCDALGAEVREYVAAPSVLGLRLLGALRKKAAERAGVEILEMVNVERIVDGRVEGRMGTKGKRGISVGADNLFIATGGPLTGFRMSGDRLFEPLTGATVCTDFEADLGRTFLSDHPLMGKGIGPELLINGFDNVRIIGATSCGFGLSEALRSGFHAGDGL